MKPSAALLLLLAVGLAHSGGPSRIQPTAPAAAKASSAPASTQQDAAKPTPTECEALWQEYFKSQECFAPYHTRSGILAEAYRYCKEVVSPAHRCGPAKRVGSR